MQPTLSYPIGARRENRGWAMRLVLDLNEVHDNIKTLESARRASSVASASAYRSLVKRGTCFLPYHCDGQLSFAPSRFIGYASNSFARHAANKARDGRQTNAALNALLGHQPVRSVALEEHYHAFCKTIDVVPSKTGTFGVERKYWLTLEAKAALDEIALAAIASDASIPTTEKEQLAKARIGQGIFRNALLARWKHCCMTGCTATAILRASHIKPWRSSTNRERLDEFNGLLLSPNMDALFDAGLISFENDGTLIVSPTLNRDDLLALGCPADIKIQVRARHQSYLRHHRTEVFRSE